MLVPRFHGVFAVGAGREQNRLPQLFDSLVFRVTGEHLFRPFDARHRRYAPLIMVVKLVAVRLESHCPCLLRFRDFFLIYAFQRVGIVGLYKYPCGAGFDKVFILLFFPLFGTGQHVEFAVFIGRFRHGIVFPFDGDLARARLITFFHDHSHKVELVGTRPHADVLSFLHVDALSCDKFRIFLQLTFFHKSPQLFLCM